MHIFEEISRNPTKCAQDMININFFSTITKLIFNRSDSDSKIDLINHTLNILKNVFTSLIIHKDSDIVIKLINNIYQSKILDHIAKNIYGYQCEIDLFKELLTLLIENYEICINYVENNNNALDKYRNDIKNKDYLLNGDTLCFKGLSGSAFLSIIKNLSEIGYKWTEWDDRCIVFD